MKILSKKSYWYVLLRKTYKEFKQKPYIKMIKKENSSNNNIQEDYDKIKEKATEYVKLMESDRYFGKFSKSNMQESIYSYTYLSMLAGVLDMHLETENDIKEKLKLAQQKDGFLYDRDILNYEYLHGDGWGRMHLMPHVIIAIETIGLQLEYAFDFLEPFMDWKRMLAFLDSLKWEDAWKTSNIVMNIGVLLQYVRDFNGTQKAEEGIKAIQEWLMKHIRDDIGMWYVGNKKLTREEKFEAIRCAYHLYPILLYDNVIPPYKESAIDLILSMQNPYGGFDFRKNSSACEDIDAIEPLIRLSLLTSDYRKKDVERCLIKAFYWIAKNQMPDGGFVFRLGEVFNYGCENLISNINESNLFATWFRMTTLLYIKGYFGGKISMKRIPGYEYPLQ